MTRSTPGAIACKKNNTTGHRLRWPTECSLNYPRRNRMKRIVTLTAVALALGVGASAQAATDWAHVDQILGRKGAEQAGGVHRYGFPRSDLTVTVDGVAIKPSLALGGWIAFLPTGEGAMFMGDLVLTDTEVNPVMQRLIADGVEITAVHNHLLRT